MTTTFKYIMVFIALTLVVACSGSTAHSDEVVVYDTYHNDRYDYSVDYPTFLIAQGEADSGDGEKFFSEDGKIRMLVYYQFKDDVNADGENLPIDKAYKEDLSYKEGVISSKIEKDHYFIESQVDDMIVTDYVLWRGQYFHMYFEYPKSEKDRMKNVIEHVIKSFKVEVLPSDATTETAYAYADDENTFVPFIKSFLNDNYWGKNFNTLLRNNDKTLANYIDPKMDVRRYYAPGTIARLAVREQDFGFAIEDDFRSKPKPVGELIFEYVNDDEESTPCELIYSEIDSEVYVVYYRRINSVPDIVVNNETFATSPVKTLYPEAEISAVYLPDTYNNPRGFYFIDTPAGWKLAFVDDSFCSA